MKDIFSKDISEEVIGRINMLNPDSKRIWGKMEAGQMLAHCNVTYELVYESQHPKPTGLKKWMIKAFVKNIVVSEKPYKRNSRTAPEFLITSDKDFEKEKGRLQSYITKTQELGRGHYEGKESHSFAKLTANEWNNLFYKHLDHHLQQFGV